MPLYEYQCSACNKVFELRQKFSDAPAKDCPSCGGAVQKLISNTAFTLKGGGWYSEGYNSNKSSSKEETSTPCASGGNCSNCPSAA